VVFVEPEQQPAIAVVRPIVSGPEDTTEPADAVVAKRELKRKQHQRHRSKLLAAFMKKKSDPDVGDDDSDGGADGKSKADTKPSATATSPAAQAESSTSETTSGRDRSSSVSFLKELTVRQTKED